MEKGNPLEDLQSLSEGLAPFLLGVTGGIASGKTTVVRMLEERGAPVIDFDVLAREVVEPGRPAWKDIVALFGEQVIREDGTLDRKGLGQIVFRDRDKRKRLEGIVHPRIFRECTRRIRKIAERDPEAIIQVDVPLLVELQLQGHFHYVLVVYVPREVQIARLIARDGISRERAEDILRAQLPIEQKVEYADFVIHNEGSLQETERQVAALWEDVKRARAERKGSGY